MPIVSLERWGRNALARTIGQFAPHPKIDPTAMSVEWSEGRIKKVLLIRPHQGLGDLLLASPIFRALKTARPQTQVHFLADHYNTLAVVKNPHLDKIWTWDKKQAYSPAYLKHFVSSLRAEKYDLAIIISSHIPSFTSFLMAQASGARVVMAFATQAHYDGANWSCWMANVELPKPPPEMPEFETFMELVRPLGIESSYEPEYYVGLEERQWADVQWKHFAFPPNRPVVGFYLGGNPDRPERLWPAASWADLARRVIQEDKATLIMIAPPPGMISGSGRSEPGVYEEFCQLLGQRPPVFRHHELKKVAAFLARLNLFVCPDGGLMHIAIASRVPTLGLCFETDPVRWVPPVPWAVGLRAPDARSSGLSADTVYAAIAKRIF